MTLNTFLLFLIATLAINLSPGPSILYVLSVAAAGGMRAALFSVLGMSVGILAHVLAAATGLAALIAAGSGISGVSRGEAYFVIQPRGRISGAAQAGDSVGIFQTRCPRRSPESQDRDVFSRLPAAVSRTLGKQWVLTGTGFGVCVHRGWRRSQRGYRFYGGQRHNLGGALGNGVGRALDTR